MTPPLTPAAIMADPAGIDDIDLLGEMADALSDQHGRVLGRIWEIEEGRGNPELREARRDYLDSVL